MLNRSFVIPVLLASASLAFAQDTTLVPSGDNGGESSSSGSAPTSILVPSTSTQAPSAGPGVPGLPTGSDQTPAGQLQQTTPVTRQYGGTNVQEEGPSFMLPGGYGTAPEKLTAGEGRFSRPPLSFSTTLQMGYDDNVYSSSGKAPPPTVIPEHTVPLGGLFALVVPRQVIPSPGVAPIRGSLLTQASMGMDVELFSSRFALSASASGGGDYYFDRPGQSPFDPSGSLNLIFAYKLTPRLQLSGMVGGAFYAQPNLTLPNAPVFPGLGDYFNLGGTFHLSYELTSRIGLDTSYAINTQTFTTSSSSGGDFIDQTVGESIRYSLSPRTTGVVEMRAESTVFNDPAGNSQTQYFLLGLDNYFTQRFSGTIRFGETARQYQVGADSPTSPYLESSLSYGYGKGSVLTWSNSYGFEEGSTATQHIETYRSNLGISEALSAKFSVSLGIGYAHQMINDVGSNTRSTYDTWSTSLSSQFVVSRSIVIFASYTRSQLLTGSAFVDYTRDLYYLGASYHF